MSKDVIYSYYEEGPEFSVREKLVDHVDECMKIVSNFNNSRIYRYLMKIPFEWSVNPSDAIRLMIVFHDVGKVFYQKNYEYDDERNVKYLSFKGHEFLSFHIFEEFSNKFVKSDADDNILSACSFSILFHHHAMNPEQRGKVRLKYDITLEDLKLDELRSLLIKFLKGKRELEALDNVFDTLIEKIKGYRSVKMFVEDITYASLKGSRYKSIWDSFVSCSTFKKISLIFLTALLTVDYLSAYRLRGGSEPSEFHKVLMEFHNYYLS
jgi:CRISPR/Cas system-associated endonuclease Cas3-HD